MDVWDGTIWGDGGLWFGLCCVGLRGRFGLVGEGRGCAVGIGICTR